MKNNGKYNRQLKLVGLCMANNSVKKYDAYDLAEMFDVEYITIQRDIRELRNMGIPVSQTANGGIEVEDSFSPDMMRSFLIGRIGMAYSTAIYDNAIKQLTHEYEMTFLKNYMQVLIGIENQKKISSIVTGYESKIDLSPLKLFQKDSEWYLLALSYTEGLKHFAIKDLDEVKVLEYDADQFPEEKIEAYIRETIFANFKKGNVKIKLQFASPDLDGHFPMKHCNYKLTKALEAGSTEVEAEVDSLDEVVKWLVESTPEVKIIEPPELISKMKKKIESFVKMTGVNEQQFFEDLPVRESQEGGLFFQKSLKYPTKKISEINEMRVKVLYDNTFNEKDFTISAIMKI